MRTSSPLTPLYRVAAFGLLGLLAVPARAAASAAPDLAVDEIDISGVQCGTCQSAVDVVVKNLGSDFPGGSSVTVELSVTPAGQTFNRKTKRQTSAPPSAGAALRIHFEDIIVSSCVGDASVFEAKVYLTGSDYREGNARNNSKRLAQPIQGRCPSAK